MFSTNVILKSKWDAWTSCAGMPVEKAMQEYISLVEKLEPTVRGSVAPSSDKRKSVIADPGGLKKQGTLFKQRDVFKGWRPRQFILQDNLLHYYLEPDDPAPRNTLDLTGCSITTSKPVSVDGVEYFPFTISHPKSSKPYHLATDSKLESDIWVSKLLEAASLNQNSATEEECTDTSTSASTVGNSSDANRFSTYNVDNPESYLFPNTSHAPETRMYIPKDLLGKIEKNIESFFELISPESPGWESFFDKNGVTGKKRFGNLIFVKAETVMPYCIYDVFSVIADINRQKEIDPQRLIHEKIKEYSNHTWVEYLRFKGVWPTSPRDFVNITHWRLLNDNRIIIFGFSEKFDDLKPPVDGHIRADMITAGYVLTPVSGGTKVQYLVKTDLKGTLPVSVVNFASNNQPSILVTIRKIMDTDNKSKNLFLNDPNKATDYGELVTLIANSPGIQEAEDLSSKSKPSQTSQPSANISAAVSQTSSSSSNSKIPPQKRATLLKFFSRTPRINFITLLMLFLPTLLYYVVDNRLRSAAFLAGILFAFVYLFRLHLGQPENKTPQDFSRKLPSGRAVLSCPVELGRLLMFLDSKRAESELEVTFTHMALKACAMVLHEMNHLNGHVIMNGFYPAKSSGIDISVSIDSVDNKSSTYKIEDANLKPIEYIADEVISAGNAIRNGQVEEISPIISRASQILPSFVSNFLFHFFYKLGAVYGFSIPQLGIKPFPLGVCSIVTSQNQEDETDVSISYQAEGSECSVPIIVTMGSLRFLPSIDSERKITGSPVLNFSVSINTRAMSLTEGRKFTRRLQQFLNDPHLLEKFHHKVAFDHEEAVKRKTIFGK